MKTIRIRTKEGIIPAMDVLYVDAEKYLEDPHNRDRGLRLTLEASDWITWKQRKKIKGMCRSLSQQATLYGNKLDTDSWSAVMIAGWRKEVIMERGIDGGLVLLGGSTTELSRQQAEEVIHLIYFFGSLQNPPVAFVEKEEQDRDWEIEER